MSSRPAYSKLVLSASAVLLVGVIVLIWPGGPGGATYLVTRGASMRPALSVGDLAVLRQPSTYRVGEAAAYRDIALRRTVLHRIVAIDHGVYTFKGDANSFLDPQRVTGSQLAGRLVLRIPRVGAALLWLGVPFNALLLAGLVLLIGWDRRRLRDLFAARPTHDGAADLDPRPVVAGVVGDRVMEITDMSFPHELAVADLPGPEGLLRMAAHYDRPVLHDRQAGLLFVVEGSMLFRCRLGAAAAAPAPSLSVVPEPTPAGADIRPLGRPRAPASTGGVRSEGGGRRPSRFGRDWAYAGQIQDRK